jgi:hypothetical protein
LRYAITIREIGYMPLQFNYFPSTLKKTLIINFETLWGYIYIHTHTQSGTKMQQGAFAIANAQTYQCLSVHPSVPHVACREGIFFCFGSKKCNISWTVAPISNPFALGCWKKMCLTKWDPWRLYLTNFFFQVCNCNLTVLWVAIMSATQLQLQCSIVNACCNHLKSIFYPNCN